MHLTSTGWLGILLLLLISPLYSLYGSCSSLVTQTKFAFRIRSSESLAFLGQFLHSIGLALALVSRGAENESISPISRGATWPT